LKTKQRNLHIAEYASTRVDARSENAALSVELIHKAKKCILH